MKQLPPTIRPDAFDDQALPGDMTVREARNWFMHSDIALKLVPKFPRVIRVRLMLPPDSEAPDDMTLNVWRALDGFIAIDDQGGGMRVPSAPLELV